MLLSAFGLRLKVHNLRQNIQVLSGKAAQSIALPPVENASREYKKTSIVKDFDLFLVVPDNGLATLPLKHINPTTAKG